MNDPRIFVDFQNADAEGRLRLTCDGTRRDIEELGVTLQDGLILRLYSDDADGNGNDDRLFAEGTAHFSKAEELWIAHIDWKAIRHESASHVSRGVQRAEFENSPRG